MTTLETKRITFDDGVSRAFVFASVIWGLVGLLVGLFIALQMSFPSLNFETPWLTFSRLRPLHTNAVIFALVGNMMFAGVYYSTQRLLKTRMASDMLSRVHLWGWQLIIVGAAITLPLGITQSKEYAELEWFLDIAVVLVWVAFAVNFFWTIAIRREKNLYVSIWFYISTVITVAVLYIVNNLAWPVTATKSYGIFSGAQDALTQWWYGHNAVAFFLTTPILGIMYYFLPKAAGRPVYSYRLSIIHFWALVFIYIWAGPHHLLNTALPDWAQTLGMVFSLMLWAPSWGGMLNGLLTLRGAWHKVRTDPVLKFFVAGVTFYGMATFEGPLLSIKAVSALGHYTDWIIGHVHSGALGWNGFMAAGMFYWMWPRLFGTKLWSTRMADMHFWIGTFGILLYVGAMWISGITHGLMWQAMTEEGVLKYSGWAEVIETVQPMYMARALGGTFFIVGWAMMIFNLYKTWRSGKAVDGEIDVAVEVKAAGEGVTADAQAGVTAWSLLTGKPVVLSVLGLGAGFFFTSSSVILATIGLVMLLAIVVWAAFLLFYSTGKGKHTWHDLIEQRPMVFSVLTLIAVVIGGVIELVPGLVIDKKVPITATGEAAAMPYTPLELAGRDVYVSEGCYNCHSQMIRPFRAEQLRYGDPSRIEESMFDHPFQWGSKRTGPDLARIGDSDNKVTWKSNVWHLQHLLNPRQMVPQSNMPAYPWLADSKVALPVVADKVRVLQKRLGVPYLDEDVERAEELYREQADAIVADLEKDGDSPDWDSEMVALIGYLQRLGGKPGVEIGIDPEALEKNVEATGDVNGTSGK